MRAVLLLILLVTSGLASAAGRAGFQLRSETSGSPLDPVLERTVVGKVEKGSLAERAGVAVGDEVTDINDQHIPGMKARALKRYSEGLGESDGLVLRVLRHGEARTIVVRPAQSSPDAATE